MDKEERLYDRCSAIPSNCKEMIRTKWEANDETKETNEETKRNVVCLQIKNTNPLNGYI